MAQNKRQKAIMAAVTPGKAYAIDEALKIVKTAVKAKFVESVDVAVRLGVDAKKSDQVVRGAVVLPNGSGDDLLFVSVEREDGRFVEVFDPDGPFVDAGAWDFTSTVVTNALDVTESLGRDRQAAAVRVFFASDTAPAGIEVSNDGSAWDRLSKTRTMERGWHEVLPSAMWRRDVRFGIRVSGDRPLEFLAVDTQ